MGKYGMKITISIPDEVYEKLEADRGLIPRATYLQELIKGSFKGGVDNSKVGTIPELKKEEKVVVEDKELSKVVIRETANVAAKVVEIESWEREEWLRGNPGKSLGYDAKRGTYFLKGDK